VRIRAAALADAPGIAEVHVQAWHEAYRELVPEEMLAALSVAENTRMWRDILASPNAIVLVAEWADLVDAGAAADDGTQPHALAGFGAAGPARDRALGTSGEVTAIYLLEAVKRRGFGRALFAGLTRALAERGHRSAGAWVLAGNTPARKFYAALGGRAGATRTLAHVSAELEEVAYVWPDLYAPAARLG